MSKKIAIIDFETRSACNLKKTNAWVYSKHETTEAMCLAYKLPGQKTKLWHMAHPLVGIEESDDPEDLFEWIRAGNIIEAHNAFFERCIWKNVMVARHWWPAIEHEQWRCSAARAAAHSLPRALENVVKVLKLDVEKDMEGHKLMMKMSKPRKPRKAEREEFKDIQSIERDFEPPLLWHEDKEDLKRLWKYCKRDVIAEHALSNELDHLSPFELKVWQMDQAMNEHGIWCDRALVEKALKLTEESIDMYNKELEEHGVLDADGHPIQASKRQAIRKWLAEEEGLELPDTKAETLEKWQRLAEQNKKDVSDRALRVLTILRSANRTSTSKYKSMMAHMDPDDDRIRGAVMYCGADRTGRFSGRGVQPHNFLRPTVQSKNMNGLCDDILTGDLDWLQMLYGDPMEALSSALRGALGAGPGCEIDVADFAAIEARVVFWVSAARSALMVFQKGGDIYLDMAEAIYGYECNKQDHPDERQMGKQAILGLGFGMGFPKFWKTLRDKYGINFTKAEARRIVPDLDGVIEWVLTKGEGQVSKSGDIDINAEAHCLAICKHIVDLYRGKYPEVVDFWSAQLKAACKAVKNPKLPVKNGLVEWFMEGKFLKCRLPSGRCLHYYEPKVKQERKPWGGWGDVLSYAGNDQETSRWGRVGTYGGKLTENVVQAIARDLMVDGMVNVHYGDNQYNLVLSVHDELIAEKPEGYKCNRGDFSTLMVSKPKWARGCPVDAEGWTGKRYRKG